MGTRYFLTVVCPECGAESDGVYYAPTCGFVEFTCPECGFVIDLEEYTGISEEEASSRVEIEAIMEAMVAQRLGDEPIHYWFGLSYAQYLTIPRSVLQSMPIEWQERLVGCLEELNETIDWWSSDGCYWVRLKDARGRFVHDPLMDYERGRRRIPRRKDVGSDVR